MKTIKKILLSLSIILLGKCSNVSVVKNSNMLNSEYQIKSIDELIEIRDKENAKFIFQDEESLAHIYRLQDGKMILLPAVGKDGLIFENEKGLKSVLANGKIPLIEDNPSPFQIEKERLNNIENNVPFFLKKMSDTLKIEIDIKRNDKLFYKEISERIKNLGYENAYKSLFISIGVFVGEKIRQKTGSKWSLKKAYGYNPYYVPELITAGRVYYPWYKLADMLLERKKFDIEKYILFVSQGMEK